MKTLYMLCGVPASGKTTWLKSLQEELDRQQVEAEFDLPKTATFWDQIALLSDYTVWSVSTDRIIEDIAKGYGSTYDECFKQLIDFAEAQMYRDLASLIKNNAKTIVWDQTNLTPKIRAEKLAKVPSDYRKVAVNFAIPEIGVLEERLGSRPGKNIPEGVMISMMNRFVPAKLEGGFDEIINVGDSHVV